MRHALLLIAFVLLGAGCHQRPDATADQRSVIRLESWFRDLKTVRLQVGADSVTLLFDTGGGTTLLTPALAHRLGCSPHGQDVGFRMTGERVTFSRCDSVRLSVGGWSRTIAPFGVFDVNALLPDELPDLDGVLALDAFQGDVISLDWNAGTVTIHDAPEAESAVMANGLPVRVATGESGRFMTTFARVEGTRGPLWLLLDSGNLRGTIVNRAVLGDSLLPLQAPDTAIVTTARRPPFVTRTVAADLIYDGVLGTDFLRAGVVTLDLRPHPR